MKKDMKETKKGLMDLGTGEKDEASKERREVKMQEDTPEKKAMKVAAKMEKDKKDHEAAMVARREEIRRKRG